MRSLSLLTLLFTVAPAWTQNDESDLFPMSIGSRWTYRIAGQDDRLVIVAAGTEKIGDIRCVRLEGRLQNRVIATEHVAKLKEGVFRLRNDGSDLEPPLMICKFPAVNGDTWRAEYKMNDKKAAIDYECDREDIVVPAGKYKAVVIRSEVAEGGGKLKSTVWYAPRVGMVKQVIEDGENKIMLSLERFDRGFEKK